MNKDKVQVVDDVMTRNEGGLEMGRDATRHMPVVRCAACCAITASPHPRICLYSSVIHICTRGSPVTRRATGIASDVFRHVLGVTLVLALVLCSLLLGSLVYVYLTCQDDERSVILVLCTCSRHIPVPE